MNAKITLPELIDLLSRKCSCTKKDAEQFLKEFFALAADTVAKGENLKINGLGQFRSIWVEPRASVNVRTGEPMEIPGHYKLTFSPDKAMREAVNAPFSCFIPEILPDDAPLSLISVTNVGDEVDDESVEVYLVDDIENKCNEAATEIQSPEVSASEIIQIEIADGNQQVSQDLYDDIKSAPASSCDEEKIVESNEVATSTNETSLSTEELEDLADEVLQQLIADAQQQVSQAQKLDTKTENPTDTSDDIPSEEDMEKVIVDTADDDSRPDVVVYVQNESLWSKLRRRPVAVSLCAIFLVFIAFAGITWYRSPVWVSYHMDNFSKKIGHIFEAEKYAPLTESQDCGSVPPNAVADIPEPENSLNSQKIQESKAIDSENKIFKESVSIEPEQKNLPSLSQSEVSIDVKKFPPMASVRIEKGQRLTLLALEYYGDKAFWVYIYEENKERIANPNNVPIGFVVKIPDARKYNIDATNPVSIAKAKEIAEVLKKKYK